MLTNYHYHFTYLLEIAGIDSATLQISFPETDLPDPLDTTVQALRNDVNAIPARRFINTAFSDLLNTVLQMISPLEAAIIDFKKELKN